jgi:tRNA dimethylallyltransferase
MNIFIVGPTAVGKTALSLRLANALGIPIISADSRQCFRGMDIGTAKPTPDELAQAQHFNVSNLDLNDVDNAAAFVDRVNQWQSTHPFKHWLIVGGSTLYLQSLLYPLDDIPKSDPEVLASLEFDAEQRGIKALFQDLSRVDPEYAQKMDGFNKQRIIRALAVFKQTGKPFSSYHNRSSFDNPLNGLIFGLQRSSESLAERISQRVDNMIDDGLVAEVQSLLDQGYDRNLNALRTVGYQEVIQMLDGQITHKVMIEQIKAHTRQYARRQRTWFRRWPNITWIDLDTIDTDKATDSILLAIESVERQPK